MSKKTRAKAIRAPRKETVTAVGGPFHRHMIRLTLNGPGTLVFRVGNEAGRYVRTGGETATWVPCHD